MKEKQVQTFLKYVVIAGSAVIAVNSGIDIYKSVESKQYKKAVLPTVELLIAVSAFSFAIGGGEVRLLPEVKA